MLSGIAMFRVGDDATPDARADDKRNRTFLIYWLFVAELIALICLLASNVFEGQIGSLFPPPEME